MKEVKFEVGKTYNTVALYGGFMFIRIVSRTETEVSFVYTDDVDEEIETKEIRCFTMTVYGKELEKLGQVTSECVEAWTYLSPYAKDENDVDIGYFTAFDGDRLYTKEEYDAL